MSSHSLPFTSLVISGTQKQSSSKKTFKVVSAQTNQIVGTAAAATSEDCSEALHAAEAAFPSWESSPYTVRRDIFIRAAELVSSEKYKSKILNSIKEETSASIGWAYGNWAVNCDVCQTLVSTKERMVLAVTARITGEAINCATSFGASSLAIGK